MTVTECGKGAGAHQTAFAASAGAGAAAGAVFERVLSENDAPFCARERGVVRTGFAEGLTQSGRSSHEKPCRSAALRTS